MSEPKNREPEVRHGSSPSQALTQERDEFVQTFFRKGAKLTEQLIRENERLREQVHTAEAENTSLRAQTLSDNAVRELLHKVEELEQEKRLLFSRFEAAEARSGRFAVVSAEVESELSDIASLYVASRQLHSTMNVRGVLRQLKEMLGQLIGAKSFAIYLVSDDQAQLIPIAWEGTPAQGPERMSIGQGPVGSTFLHGVASINEDCDTSKCDAMYPAACIPMRVEQRTVGVVAIWSTFEQKSRFEPVDYEFFKLLASHAAPALVSARLFAQADGRIPAIEGFLDLGV